MALGAVYCGHGVSRVVPDGAKMKMKSATRLNARQLACGARLLNALILGRGAEVSNPADAGLFEERQGLDGSSRTPYP